MPLIESALDAVGSSLMHSQRPRWTVRDGVLSIVGFVLCPPLLFLIAWASGPADGPLFAVPLATFAVVAFLCPAMALGGVVSNFLFLYAINIWLNIDLPASGANAYYWRFVWVPTLGAVAGSSSSVAVRWLVKTMWTWKSRAD